MQWNLLTKPSPEKILALQNALGISETLCILLLQRGIETFDLAKDFFRPNQDLLHDPFLMKNMDLAVQRIEKAISANEKILIYGDYDVDGTTAVALLFSFLKEFYSELDTYIPDRHTEGYGISFRAIDFASENQFSLIIALDCGIKSVEQIDYANQKNIDFIVCDHHLPGEILPNAVAILNPKQPDCNYPYKELSGCGIGYKLALAVEQTLFKSISKANNYLDLVAISIAADIVPITNENRTLAALGLNYINKNPRLAFEFLLNQKSTKSVSISDIVFKIAPRINAAGRMDHGKTAVALLTEKKAENIEIIAKNINTFNQERKIQDLETTQQALEIIKQNNEEKNATTVVFQPHWHLGVIGIVASRLTETYYRPTIVFTKNNDKLTASARSVKNFDIYKAISHCAEHLLAFGGHSFAAGLSLLPEKLEDFKRDFEIYVQKNANHLSNTPITNVDATINFSEITPKFIRVLLQFEPHGPQNMTPVFWAKNVSLASNPKSIGKANEHLKISVSQNSQTLEAIGFNLAHKLDFLSSQKTFDIIFQIQVNHWNGKSEIQLLIKDIF